MVYKIKWIHYSSITYFNEIDFIFLKWNQKETEKFIFLVDENLKRIAINPYIAKPINSVYKIVISKQTTLYYKVSESDKRIDLLVFWNNLKNPADLIRLL